MPWIFSFAELGPQQIEEMLGHAPFCSLPASTPNSKVTFKGKSRKWASSTATLEKCRGNWVYGSALLIPANELAIFDKYYTQCKQQEIPILIDATKDKVKAITYIIDSSAPYGEPSDDYTKAMLKHLKFFWGQGDGVSLTLENFGINTTIPNKKEKEDKKEDKKEEKVVTAETVKNIFSDLDPAMAKSKNRKKART